jgi:tRNA (adenine22-N1)-methyltransferase
MELSKRLQAIASYIPSGARVADIGGDHAWLLVALAQEGRIASGLVGEVRLGPYQNAQSRVREYGCEKIIDVRLGDGLSVYEWGEVDVVVIAGMGGTLIRDILQRGKEKLAGVKRLVLQPNVAGKPLREWLLGNGWVLVDEELVLDQEILYEIIVAEPGEGERIEEDWRLMVGPLLWQKRHPLLRLRLQREIEKMNRVFMHLGESKRSAAAQQKRKQVKEEIEQIERMITWLSEERN